MTMEIQLDPADMLKIKTMLAGIKNGPDIVTVRSINKTGNSVISKAAKEIASHYNLTVKRIKEDFTFNRATRAKPTGSVVATGKPVSLTTFKNTTQLKLAGLSVSIKVGKRFKIKHGFIATPKHIKIETRKEGRGEQAFWRENPPKRNRDRLFKIWRTSPKYGVLPYEYRYRVWRLTGPRVEDEYNKPRTFDVVTAHATERIKTIAYQEVNYLLSKYK